MSESEWAASRVSAANVNLDSETFMKNLIRDLSGALQDVVGIDEAAGFVSIVGQRMGERLNDAYKEALGKQQFSRDEVAEVLVDLKRRIRGNFSVIEKSDEKIVYANTQCPFAEKVIGRPAMCMMTSNVFGAIAAENLGYARVALEQTIAGGASGCRVAVHLQPPLTGSEPEGREYFKSGA